MAEALKNIYFSVFIDGFLFVYGLSANPFRKQIKFLDDRSDEQAIANDWSNVSSDFRKAFDRSVQHVQ